ncbi:MAG: ABC transporter permease [Actinobacteria bacterium 13_2_20CM_2_72_6]|jgi:N-acetylglucosamine transport system permease protein|nr:MAG: ABC transporter permease [Actinobacteria bacterium 13_2_20CM_2_72_6]
MRHGRYRFVASFLAVPLVLYTVFVVSPYAQAFYIALTSWNGFTAPKYVGFANFTKMFHDDLFWKAVQHNLFLLIALPLVTVVIALFLSFMLNVAGRSRGGVRTGVWGSKFYRVVFFFPQLLALAIIGVLFQQIMRPDESGAINGPLHLIGIGPVGFLTNPTIAMWSLVGVLVWQAVGFYVVLFSAGMSNIPQEIYEAADLDGAGRFNMFFRVTLPLLFDTIQVAWVYLGIAAFDAFALVQVLTVEQGGPDGATTVLANEVFKHYLRQAGYAAAIGVALFFLTLTFAALTIRLSRRERIDF